MTAWPASEVELGARVVEEQAWDWHRFGCAHWVWVAVPERRLSHMRRGRGAALRFLHDHGVGLLEMSERYSVRRDKPGRAMFQPAFLRGAQTTDLLAALNEKQKTSRAGSVSGGYWTPFRDTCDQLRAMLAKAPEGIRVRAAVS